ncbi:MAG: DNA-binding protein [Methylophilus sp.]|uniref:DNA-binding protein n=1 Tax=unclassified Methylophilus TaxID=2630143 RepID=UPI0006713F8F|nr:DNA-binding protein [Methylophilus sp. TWE2]AKR42372.1 hypothetical protein ACJ67_02220 [Methylophilus sp. TWE2]
MISFDQAKSHFQAEGISIAEWSRSWGFKTALVYRVLRGEAKCLRGESHNIAMALGIKEKSLNSALQIRMKETSMEANTSEGDASS